MKLRILILPLLLGIGLGVVGVLAFNNHQSSVQKTAPKSSVQKTAPKYQTEVNNFELLGCNALGGCIGDASEIVRVYFTITNVTKYTLGYPRCMIRISPHDGKGENAGGGGFTWMDGTEGVDFGQYLRTSVDVRVFGNVPSYVINKSLISFSNC